MTEEILSELKTRVNGLSLQPGSGGMFEVSLNDQVIFSKKESGRFPNEGEVLDKIRAMIK